MHLRYALDAFRHVEKAFKRSVAQTVQVDETWVRISEAVEIDDARRASGKLELIVVVMATSDALADAISSNLSQDRLNLQLRANGLREATVIKQATVSRIVPETSDSSAVIVASLASLVPGCLVIALATCLVSRKRKTIAPQHQSAESKPEPALGSRKTRWADGLESPSAGARVFLPQGYEINRDVSEAISQFGHSPDQVTEIMIAGAAKAANSPTPLAASHAAALYAYTTENPQLYRTLNFAMRTPHSTNTPTDDELLRYADYIVHADNALNCLPTHVSEQHGYVYRGMKTVLNREVYATGRHITWQAFSSSTKKQMETLNFLEVLPGRKLQGSVFVIQSITAKDIRHFSEYPSEEEVLFSFNSQFKVESMVEVEEDKINILHELAAYDMADLDVYLLRQVA